MLVRLQKYLAHHGIASRRKCEEYIEKGFIKVNGATITKLGTKIDPSKDQVSVDDGLKLSEPPKLYLMLHKPVGYVTTVTGKEKPSVMELFKNVKERIFPVGRLDKDSSGLLIFTNDGQLTFKLTHPSQEKEKEYEVSVAGKLTPGIIRKLEDGIKLFGEKTLPTKIDCISQSRFRIILREGKNRQIRRICRKVGLTVRTLKRIRIGKLWLGKLPVGHFRILDNEDLQKLSLTGVGTNA